MINPDLTIKVLSRDSPQTLELTLLHIKRDIAKSDFYPLIILIDDSKEELNRVINKSLLENIFSGYRFLSKYLGKKEWDKVISSVKERNPQMGTLFLENLGSASYQPSRAKNVSQLVIVKATTDFELLIDDDILIDPQNESKYSIIKKTMEIVESNKCYASVNLLGFPDISSLQLLEKSIINNEEDLHVWNRDTSSCMLSGGFLLYPNDVNMPMFPNIYNEDFAWVAYGTTKRNLGAERFDFKVYHSPSRQKKLSKERLIYEANGEIFYETLRMSNLKNIIEHRICPTIEEIEMASENYLEYVKFVLNILNQQDNGNLESTYLGKINVKECKTLIVEHIACINGFFQRELLNSFDNWIKNQKSWVQLRQDMIGLQMNKKLHD